jgi:hypothetical protein
MPYYTLDTSACGPNLLSSLLLSVSLSVGAAPSLGFHRTIDPDIPTITLLLRAAIILALRCKLHWLPFDSSFMQSRAPD